MNPFGRELTRYEHRSESLLKVADYFKAGEAKRQVVEMFALGISALAMIEWQ